MKHKFGLFIIAAFLSLALSSVGATTDEATLWAVGNLENPSSQDPEAFFIDDTDAGRESSISSGTTYRIDTPLRRFSSSDSFRRAVRRTANVCHPVIDNGDNVIRNTLHSFACFTHSRHSSGINEPARYLIRLRKFII